MSLSKDTRILWRAAFLAILMLVVLALAGIWR